MIAQKEKVARLLHLFEKGVKGPDQDELKKHGVKLTDEERSTVMSRKAVWHHGPHGEATPAISKAEIGDKIWYWCATHRSWSGAKTTLAGAINAYHRTVKRNA